ncbi:hypothetical protein J7L02_02300 [Candidatus Woesearchaeota archaeon]|nr:hypothetical protein [Candidatus Woesearchaeota archaeon]
MNPKQRDENYNNKQNQDLKHNTYTGKPELVALEPLSSIEDLKGNAVVYSIVYGNIKTSSEDVEGELEHYASLLNINDQLEYYRNAGLKPKISLPRIIAEKQDLDMILSLLKAYNFPSSEFFKGYQVFSLIHVTEPYFLEQIREDLGLESYVDDMAGELTILETMNLKQVYEHWPMFDIVFAGYYPWRFEANTLNSKVVNNSLESIIEFLKNSHRALVRGLHAYMQAYKQPFFQLEHQELAIHETKNFSKVKPQYFLFFENPYNALETNILQGSRFYQEFLQPMVDIKFFLNALASFKPDQVFEPEALFELGKALKLKSLLNEFKPGFKVRDAYTKLQALQVAHSNALTAFLEPMNDYKNLQDFLSQIGLEQIIDALEISTSTMARFNYYDYKLKLLNVKHYMLEEELRVLNAYKSVLASINNLLLSYRHLSSFEDDLKTSTSKSPLTTFKINIQEHEALHKVQRIVEDVKTVIENDLKTLQGFNP